MCNEKIITFCDRHRCLCLLISILTFLIIIPVPVTYLVISVTDSSWSDGIALFSLVATVGLSLFAGIGVLIFCVECGCRRSWQSLEN